MDLADQIDDYICSFEGIGDIAMDSLAMFVFIWAVLALFLVWLCKFLYNKYVKKDETNTATSNGSTTTAIGAKKLMNGDKPLRLSEPKEILASKEVKDIAAKPLGGAIGAARGRQTTPTSAGIRKRIVRQTSTGPDNRKKRNAPPPSNVVGPETTSVTWTSQVFRWLYNDLVVVNELLNSWVQAINETLKKSVVEQGLAIEVVRVLPDSPSPALTNLFCDCDESNPADMVISCDCDAMPVLQVKTFRQKTGKVETSHYKVTVSRLRARVAAPMNYNTLKGEMKIDGYPDIRITMNSVGAIRAVDQDEQQFQDTISEILTTAIRETTYPIDFSIYSTCPRSEIEPPEIPVNYNYPSPNYPIHYDSMAHNMEAYNQSMPNSFNGHGPLVSSGKRLLVKVVKGEGLQNAKDPYCVVEMDEPPQKNQTGARQGTNPYWDEHFLFDLSQQSAEILFEVYDRPVNPNDQPKFLGLGLVGIDELTIGPSSSQVLTLQPRPYETEKVSGAIMIEFVVIEGPDIPAGPRPYKLKEALKISTPAINEHMKNGSDLADAAVRAIQDGALSANGNPSKSTLIIHSVQRIELNKAGEIEVKEVENSENPDVTSEEAQLADQSADAEMANGQVPTSNEDVNEISHDETGNDGDFGPSDEFGRPMATSSPHNNHTGNHLNGNGTMPQSSYSNGNNNSNSLSRDQALEAFEDDRGRSKKRNFFGTLKRRLGRSKTRANSADRDGGMIPIDLENPNGESRSISVDRGFLSKSNSLGPKIVVPDHSRRSSISESSAISGFSGASNKTYVHEASTLILETIENGVKRHFIVPLHIAQKPKWRRKGTKLHVYNDHTFVAKHLSGGGLQCAICVKSIPRRPGKQGYECRDCQLICHKQCHVRAPQSCPNPTILSTEITKLNTAAADRSIRKL